jgi:hypothetical protein
MISGFELFVIARMFVAIYHRQALKFVDSLNLPPKILKFGIRLPKSGNIQNLAH